MNEDLTAIRELTDEIASSRPEPSLARSWLAITDRQPKRPQRTMPRRLLPVAAGLAVVMAVAAGWYLVGPGSAASHKQLPADGQSLPVAQAWDAIIAAARTAEPVAVHDHTVLLVTEVGEGAAVTVDGSPWQMKKQDRVAAYDPRGMVLTGYTENGQDQQVDPVPTGPPAHPDLTHITVQWIASLPTDPGQLRDLLLQQSEGVAGDWSNRHGLWEALAELFHAADFAVPVDVRAAIYRVLAQEKGLAANLTTVDGRAVYVISRFERDDVQQLLFDPANGRCIGRRSLFLGEAPGAPSDRVLSWSIWQQQLKELG